MALDPLDPRRDDAELGYCATCYNWNPIGSSRDHANRGECRHNSPACDIITPYSGRPEMERTYVAAWPITRRSDWCRQWK